ncbi:hypothetical protein EJB05_27045, partial [Eragrostis curvula]
MDSKQHHDGVTAQDKVPVSAALMPAAPSVLAQAARAHMNQHSPVRADRRVVLSRRGPSSNGVSTEITQGDKNFVVVGRSLHQEDLDCTAIRYHGDGLDVIFSVDGAFKRVKFIFRHEDTEGRVPIIQLLLMDLSDSAHQWVWDFAVQVMEQMHGSTRHQMYNAISALCSAVCTRCLQPPLINLPSGDLKKNHVYITDISDYDVVAINLGNQELPGKATEMNYNGPFNNPYQ